MRKLMIAAFSFAVGVFVFEYFGIVPAAVLAALCIAACVFGLVSEKSRRKTVVLILSVSTVFGAVYAYGYNSVFVLPVEALDGTYGEYSYTLRDYPVESGYGVYLDAETKIDGKNVRVRLYLNNDIRDELIPGGVITCETNLSSAKKLYGKENYTFPAKGISLFAYQRSDFNYEKPERINYLLYPKAIAYKIDEQIGKLFSEDVRAFFTALLTGNTSRISDEVKRELQLSGIYHIVSVSGMHIGFLVSLCVMLAGNKKRAAKFCIPLLIVFAAITGFRPSTVRAVIMQIVLIMGLLINRESDGLTSLSFALLLLLLANPVSIHDVGLQLSFLAALGLIIIAPRIENSLSNVLPKGKNKLTKILLAPIHFIVAAVGTSVGAMIFTVPLTAYYFGYISLISPITNIVTMFAVAITFISGAIVTALSFAFLPIGSTLAVIPKLFADYVFAVSGKLASIDNAVLFMSNELVIIWFIGLYAAVMYLLIRKKPIRSYLIPTCVFTAMLCVILIASPYIFEGSGLTAYSMDVGQGASSIFVYDGHTILVDCGSSSGENAGNITADFLMGWGKKSADALILTHYHTDHTNGVEQLLRRIDVDKLVVPKPVSDDEDRYEALLDVASSEGTQVIVLENNARIGVSDAVLRIYTPISALSENERCLTVLFSLDDYDILIDGDLDGSMETRLFERAGLPDIELLFISHHGSSSSTTESFLELCKPETAVISVGANSYGHPSQKTLNRLAKRNVTIYRTDKDGNVKIKAER